MQNQSDVLDRAHQKLVGLIGEENAVTLEILLCFAPWFVNQELRRKRAMEMSRKATLERAKRNFYKAGKRLFWAWLYS